MVFEIFSNLSEAILAPILSPLLNFAPLAAIAIFSFMVSLIITIIYKYTTDQDLLKRLKEEIKELQKKAKELRAHPEKSMEVNKEIFAINAKQMSQSMRSMMFTFIPIILIFGWANAHMAYYPLLPGQEFTATLTFVDGFDGDAEIMVGEGLSVIGESVKQVEDSTIVFTLKGVAGEYLLDFKSDGKSIIERPKEVIISEERDYAKVKESYRKGDIKSIKLSNEPIKPLGSLGWLGTYILFSIVFSSLLRKILKVY